MPAGSVIHAGIVIKSGSLIAAGEVIKVGEIIEAVVMRPKFFRHKINDTFVSKCSEFCSIVGRHVYFPNIIEKLVRNFLKTFNEDYDNMEEKEKTSEAEFYYDHY